MPRAGCTRPRRASHERVHEYAAARADRRRPLFRRLAALAQPADRAQAAADPQGGRRSEPDDRQGRDPGAGRRIRLRQVDGCTADRRPVPADAGRNPVRRPAHRFRRRGARAAAHDADDLPGSVRQPQPALARGGHRRRADPRARYCANAARNRGAGDRAARAGRPCRRGRRQISAPVLGRAAAAHLDRARAWRPIRPSSSATSRRPRSTCRCRRRC